MFKTFFLTEIKGALKQPMIYIFFGLMALLVFGAVVSDNIVIGGSVGNVFKNSPHTITMFTSILSIFGLLIATAFFNNAALRDIQYNFNEILFSTPVSKGGYFFGRFFGAMLLATIPLTGIFAGALLGAMAGPLFGWLDPDRIGSFYMATFVNNYLLFILPNMFIAGAIIFALANIWKSTIISFVGTLIIIIGYLVSGTLLSDVDNETIAALTDTFGIRAYAIESKYFTSIEKNTLSPGFAGILMANRLLWSGIGAAILFLSYLGFSFRERNKKVARNAKLPDKTEVLTIPQALPEITRSFGLKTEWQQFFSFFKTDFLSIVKSNTFRILFLFTAIILISNLLGGFEYYGLQSYPVTYKMIDQISSSSAIFVIIILVFFSGELVWKDRMSHIHEVVDSSPHSSFTSLASKAVSLVFATFIIHAFSVLVVIAYQLFNGYSQLELSVYFRDFIYTTLPTYFVWSGLLIFIQVLINHKYLAYFVSVLLIFLSGFLFLMLDVESKMLQIAEAPSLMYSDMNDFGPGLTGAAWFNLYWSLFAIICLLIAGLIWIRGATTGLKDRMKSARIRLSGKYALMTGSVLVVWFLAAGFIYYNTQILHTYDTSDVREENLAEYEKKYKKYQGINLPKITDVTYHIEIYPYQRDVMVKADIRLRNTSGKAIDSLHYTLTDEWETKITIPGAEQVYHDEEFDYLIYLLKDPLQPGDSLDINISTAYLSNGFENNRGSINIIENGTFLNNFSILPAMGYMESVELQDKNTRKKHGLKPKDRMPALKDPCGEPCMKNSLTNGLSDWVNVESFISTARDQVAIAPGSLVKQWEENGRNHYHYKLDHPSMDFYSFISGRYEIARRNWKDVDIEIYHHNKHPYNIEMMMDAVERSLEYYTEHFGPYYHKQARIIEFPRYSQFAQAFPGTMPYSESIGFIINMEDEEDNNIVDAVIAHEMAHQWWAHQETSANVQGATMLTETFSEYSALMVMKTLSDDMKMKEFLKYNLNNYLRGRSTEREKEMPLYKVENQGYIHYRKGSLVMYALQDYIGEEKVNTALRSFLEEYRYQEPPYPTTLDFLRHLEPHVPDSLNYFIEDWFKSITLYDNRLINATYRELESGKYEVTMDIESYKIKADTIGNEEKVRINDWMEIGVYADSDEKKLLYKKRVKFDQPEMIFTFTVDTIPAKAAIDPRKIVIERIYSDNVKTVGKI